ncbi:COG3014 family protein [Helicobacter salomonis]|uniref:COG3014 family protein n=1 Tax=Helicobacter salomonis TaxID=56878 RepID=UPI000CF12636|nr:hypothetical protein [Helicobacter salomonis]
MWRYCYAILIVLFFAGCTGHRSEFARFDRAYYSPLGMQNAYLFSTQMSTKDHKDGSLWDLQRGMSALMLGQYKDSISALDAAETLYNHHINLFNKSMSNVGAVLVNDNVKTYIGSIYESVLMNYYKAMDYMLIGDPANARVEFNRANDRQRRAKEFYYKQIQKAIEKMREKGSARLSAQDSESKVQEVLSENYSNLDRFAAYSDLINPAVSYLSGLFFALNSERAKGVDYLKEAYGISHAISIGEDLLFFQHPSEQKFTWIFIEDGKQATKQEFKITLPIPIPEGIYTASLALPQLVDGTDFHSNFSLSTAHQQRNFEELVLLDGLIGNEFKKQLPYIITRAITSTVLKVGLEAISNQYLGVLGGLFSSLYAAVSTSADIRSPTIFPHKIYIARVNNASGEQVHIRADDQDIYNFTFVECHGAVPLSPNTFCVNKHNIIYIRSFGYTSIAKALW